jgi:hypothetical protein
MTCFDVGRMMTAGQQPSNNETLSQLNATPERARMSKPRAAGGVLLAYA